MPTNIQLPCSDNYQLQVQLTDIPALPGQTHIQVSSLLSSAKNPGDPQRRLDATLDQTLLRKLARGILDHIGPG